MRPDCTPLKTCTKCGRELPATTEFFYPRSDRPCGITARCRACCDRSRTEYARKNESESRTRERERRDAAKRSATKACKECGLVLPATTEFFAPEPRGIHGVKSVCRECKKAYFRAYNARNAEKRREQTRQWRTEHADYLADHRRRYWRENRESLLAAHRNWAAKNPHIVKRGAAAAHARLRNAPGSHTHDDLRAQYERQRGRCYWCGKSLRGRYEVDHVVPLARGGSNGPENLVAACRPCNRSKSAKHPMDWSGTMF